MVVVKSVMMMVVSVGHVGSVVRLDCSGGLSYSVDLVVVWCEVATWLRLVLFW